MTTHGLGVQPQLSAAVTFGCGGAWGLGTQPGEVRGVRGGWAGWLGTPLTRLLGV